VKRKEPKSFHSYFDASVRPYQVFHPGKGWVTHVVSKHIKTEDRHLSYQIDLHEHPYVKEMMNALIRGSVDGLEAVDTAYVTKPDGSFEPLKDSDGKIQKMADGTVIPLPQLYNDFFKKGYRPSGLVEQPLPVMDLDFTSSGAYSVYNWELFYHVPITLAIHLSQNQQFVQAQKWFHYIFDPTDDSDGPTPERFWKVKPLEFTDVAMIEQVLTNLSTGKDAKLKQDTTNCIEAWKKDPFRPFLIARYRQSAFKFKAVMAYLDNLIAWGDSLFSQYTGETINEALQLYILAANILGPKPQEVPVKESKRPQTYASMRAHLDAFGNDLEAMESEIPMDLAPHPHKVAKTEKLNSVGSTGQTSYFCTPRNDQLLGYWNTVADRLFKIHNSLNMQGVFQQVPLFDPPIDPALLVRAAAEGLDVNAIVTGLNQPLPLVRFTYLLQKATEACQEVKSLGGALLAAIEKKDNEALAMLRSQHETALLKLGEAVKYAALQEAIKNREGVEQSLANAATKYTYYQNLLGVQQVTIPKLDPIDTESLKKLAFNSKEPSVKLASVQIDISGSAPTDGGFKTMSSHEVEELNLMVAAEIVNAVASVLSATGAVIGGIVPDIKAHAQPLGVGVTIGTSGLNFNAVFAALADVVRGAGEILNSQAAQTAKAGSYARRQQEWTNQSNAAAGEITQLFKQLRAAQIREAMAEMEWKNHQVQIKQSEAVEQFLQDKTSNVDFYVWMKREVKSLYGQGFQFAFNIARKAERALQQELGDPMLSFIQYGDLSGKEGLLAGEKLYADIKRMDMAYADLNKREYELTKHVSLLQANPAALLQFRATGKCTFDVPEELFDFDCPGEYFRRIKSVAVSIPCVVGPYTSLNCKLTLAKSSIRTSTMPGDNGYARAGANDGRFSDFLGSIQAIVTSSGQNDSGLFETNLHDERKLPFEFSGAIGQWQLELPASIRQFDFSTISDVILHLRYTAREGGDALRSQALSNLEDSIGAGKTVGSIRLFSMRHEFPSDWAKFKNSAGVANPPALAPLTVTMRPEHYPFWSQGRLQSLLGVTFYAHTGTDIQISDAPDGSGNKDTLVEDDAITGYRSGSLKNIALPQPTGPWAFYFSDNSMDELWMAVVWGKQN
jgi:Tc toxin complex TcA C-terminal TcB-binding domain